MSKIHAALVSGGLAALLLSGCASATDVYAQAVTAQDAKCREVAAAGRPDQTAACRERLELLRQVAACEEAELADFMDPPLFPNRDPLVDRANLGALGVLPPR